MELRIRGDSVRLRLKRGEVEQIASGHSVKERTHFAGSVLTCLLEVCDDAAFSANFDGCTIVIRVPKTIVRKWADTDEVSIFSEQAIAASGCLSILIEKDFSCLEPGHHRDCEDDEDTFPHPAQSPGSTV